MYKYFLSENLKTKHTFANKLIYIAPIFLCLLSLILSFNYFNVQVYNIWYMDILPIILLIECSSLIKIDGLMKNISVLGQPLDLKKVWYAKIFVCIKNLLISCIVLLLSIEIITLILPTNISVPIAFFSGLIAIIILVLTLMWQIPLWMIIASKLGMFYTVIVGLTLNVIGSIIAINSSWIYNPFSYPARFMCPILKILPNGLLAIPESVTFTDEVLNLSVIPIGIVISLILFLFLSYVTSNIFSNKEAI